MEIGASSACFYPLETEKSFQLLAEHGFKNIEIFFNSPCETNASFIKELKNIKEHYGVNVTSVHPYESFGEGYNFFSAYRRRYADACENYKRFFSAAAQLGASYVIMHGAKHGADICDEEYAERFTRLNETAMTYGCFMAHENVVNFLGQKPEFISLLKKYGKENFKMVLDVKQARKANVLPIEYIRAAGESIIHVHLSDCNENSLCAPPSEDGFFDFGELFNQLESINYKGKYIIELYSDGFNGIEDIINSAKYLECVMQDLKIKI
jgi:sugar phosphate isomerase/epimerase